MVVPCEKWIVVDLDGTLCNIGHREHLAQARQWDDFNSLCHADKVNEPIAEMVRRFYGYYGILVVTGRSDKWREMTIEWLMAHKLWPLVDRFRMRQEGDMRSDTIVKPEMVIDCFGTHVNALDKVLFILDDRYKVVKEFRRRRFTVFHVEDGAY
jgi:FMN phosphatase YigB (HAD superfamily)